MTDHLTGPGATPDVVVIGAGVGGAAVALKLAGTGAKVLLLERGPAPKDEPELSDAEAVFVQNRYRITEEWQDPSGPRFLPGQFYYLGGHTKFYGTAMFRCRESDFARTPHEDGTSPAWPVGYGDLEPFYGEAEALFGVRGAAGIDPTEPPRSAPFRHGPVPHEPVIALMAAGRWRPRD